MALRAKTAVAAVAACAVFALIVFKGRSSTPAPAQATVEASGAQLQSANPNATSSRRAAVAGANPLMALDSASLMSKVLLNPLAQPAEKLRALGSMSDPFEAQLFAVWSGDPLLLVSALYMTMHCSDPAVQLHGRNVREWMTEHGLDPKTGAKIPPDERDVAMNEAAQQLGPRRIYPPADLRTEIAKRQRDWVPGQIEDVEASIELLKKLSAPLSPAEKSAYDTQIAQASTECRGRATAGTDFGTAYRAALDRMVASGVVSALLFNQKAGWQSKSTADLNDRDYELVERAINEAQPDGIARLLAANQYVVGNIDYTALPDDAIEAGLSLGFHLGTLAACELGVSDCGPTSWRFRIACMGFGGCDQPDLATLLHHVFQRDGLDPRIIDREVARVVAAYRARDLEALGIRRKPPPK